MHERVVSIEADTLDAPNRIILADPQSARIDVGGTRSDDFGRLETAGNQFPRRAKRIAEGVGQLFGGWVIYVGSATLPPSVA